MKKFFKSDVVKVVIYNLTQRFPQAYYNVFSDLVNANKHHIYLVKSKLGYNTGVKTSRQRLLEYIQTHRQVTVAELSRVLRMSRANARHHLAILEQQGLVRVAGERPAETGRGRPALLYGLAESVQAHSLGELSGVLLELLEAEVAVELRPALYQKVACALKSTGLAVSGDGGRVSSQSSGGQFPRPVSLTQRLAASVQNLNQLNYQARWEAHAQGPRLILGHCPYAAILKRHPEMCQIDRHLLEELSGAPVEQTERLAKDERGAPFCRFVLQTR